MDATWSVRMPEDMKEKISNMITESGLNSKDFLTQAIQMYELKTARKLQPLMESDIDELTQITGRVHNIFINLCERITSFQKQRDEEFKLKLKEKEETVTVFSDRIKMYEERVSEYEKEAEIHKKQIGEALEQHANLIDACDANKALAAEYKEKNETLTGVLGEYKGYKNMIDTAKKELEKEKISRQATELKLSESINEVKQLKAELIQIKKDFQIELEQKLEMSQIQKEKEILSVKKEAQQNLETAQKEYTGKIKELLEIIEEQQKSRPVKRTSKKAPSGSSKS